MQKVADEGNFTKTLKNKKIYSEVLVHSESIVVLENLHNVNGM